FERADFRRERAGRKSRRRCEGTLLVHRQHAVAQFHADDLSLSAIAFSLRRTGRPKRRALENRGRIRNLEHTRIRGKPLLRHRDRVRQSGRVRHFDPRDRKKLWARTSLAPFATNALVSQYLELGTKPTETESPQNCRPRARRCDHGGPPLARRLRIIL